MAEPDLLPCPFCGAEARLIEAVHDAHGPFVECTNIKCEICQDGGNYLTEAEAIAAWNYRTPSPAPDQTNAEVSDERLREIIEKLLDMEQVADPQLRRAAAISLLNRRSVTSQASEGALAQRILGAIDDARATAPEDGESWESWYAASLDLLGEKVAQLLASPSKRVERLEAALTKWQAYDQVLRTIDGTMLLGGDMPSVDALYDECVMLTAQALGGRS